MLEAIHDAVSEARHLHRGRAQGEHFGILQKDKSAKGGARQVMSDVENMDAVIRAIGKAPDIYISQARFKRPFRRVSMLSGVDALWVDVDSTQKTGRAPDAALMTEMIARLSEHGVPEPTYIVKSGHGLYAKWILDQTANASSHPVWSATQKMLAKLLLPFGADRKSTDAARVLRPIGSLHSEVNHEVSIERMSGRTVSLDEVSRIMSAIKVSDVLRDDVLQGVKPEAARRRATRAQQNLTSALDAGLLLHEGALERFTQVHTPIMLGRKKTLDTLNWARFLDLRDLAILRGGFRPGERDLFLFWMINHLALSGSIDPDNFELEVGDLLEAFPQSDDFNPIEDGSLTTLLSKVEAHARGETVKLGNVEFTPLYTAKNDTLIDLFEITDDEQLHLSTIISDSVKRARRATKELLSKRGEGRQDRKRHLAQIVASTSPLKATAAGTKASLVEAGLTQRAARRWNAKLGNLDAKKRAVRALLEQGKSAQEVSSVLGVPLSSVYRWKKGPSKHEIARQHHTDALQVPVCEITEQTLRDLEAWAAERERRARDGDKSARNTTIEQGNKFRRGPAMSANATTPAADGPKPAAKVPSTQAEKLAKQLRSVARARGKDVEINISFGAAPAEQPGESPAKPLDKPAPRKVDPFAAVLQRSGQAVARDATTDNAPPPRPAQVITSIAIKPSEGDIRETGREPTLNESAEDGPDVLGPIEVALQRPHEGQNSEKSAPAARPDEIPGGNGSSPGHENQEQAPVNAPERESSVPAMTSPPPLASPFAQVIAASPHRKESSERRQSGPATRVGEAGDALHPAWGATFDQRMLLHPGAPGIPDAEPPHWDDAMLPPGSQFSRDEWSAAREAGMWHVVEVWAGTEACLVKIARSGGGEKEFVTKQSDDALAARGAKGSRRKTTVTSQTGNKNPEANAASSLIGIALDGCLLLGPTADSPWRAQAQEFSIALSNDPREGLPHFGYRVLTPREHVMGEFAGLFHGSKLLIRSKEDPNTAAADDSHTDVSRGQAGSSTKERPRG